MALPPIMHRVRDSGAILIPLGKVGGLDSWLGFKGDVQDPFFVSPDGQALIAGLAYAMDGSNLTMGQMQANDEVIKAATAEAKSIARSAPQPDKP